MRGQRNGDAGHLGRPQETSSTKESFGRVSLRALASTGTQFLKSTTLHGFKYFRDPHVAERLFWLVVHGVNACCACALCAALWQRFVQDPSILAVQPAGGGGARAAPEPYPALTLCPPSRILHSAAERFVAKLSLPPGLEVAYLVSIVPQLAALFVPGLITRHQQDLFMLDLVLSSNNLTYREALDQLAPTCDELLISPLGEQAADAVTLRGAWTTDEQNSREAFMAVTTGLGVVLNTSAYAVTNPAVDCTKFKMEDISMNSLKSDYLALPPGNEYWAGAARVRVSSKYDGSDLPLVKCDPNRAANPSRRRACLVSFMACVVRVMVARCGCVGPTYPRAPGIQPCPPSRLPCLIAINEEAVMHGGSCDCLPPCDKSRIFTEVESMPLSALDFTFDPFYRGLHEHTVVLRTYLASHRHRLSSLEPTVSWLTLLSSLGGVFNMFLGVGLVSLLEVLFFALVRLPLNAVRAHRNPTVSTLCATHKETS